MGKKSGNLRAARRSRQAHRQRQKVRVQLGADAAHEELSVEEQEALQQQLEADGVGENLESVLDRAIRKSGKKQRITAPGPACQLLDEEKAFRDRDDDADADADVDEDLHTRMLDSMEASNVRHRKRDRGGPADKPGLATAVLDAAEDEFDLDEEGGEQPKKKRSTVNRLLSLLGGSDRVVGSGATKAALRGEMRALERRHKVLAPVAPLEQALAGRKAAYERASSEATRWAPAVARLRTAQGLDFPLERADALKMQSSEDYALRGQEHCNGVLVRVAAEMAATAAAAEDGVAAAAGAGPAAPLLVKKNSNPVAGLEARLYGALYGSKVREMAKVAAGADKADADQEIIPNLRDLELRLTERRKLLARQSYLASHAKRQSKIKSKQYRRHQRRAVVKNELGELETLKETDPEAFAQRLAQLDRQRAEERVSQRHRSGSKFAAAQKLRAKYDDTARDAVQNMIAKNRELSDKRLHKTLMGASAAGKDADDLDTEDEEEEVRAGSFLAMQLSTELSNTTVATAGAATADEGGRGYRVPQELANVFDENVQKLASSTVAAPVTSSAVAGDLRLDYVPEVENNEDDNVDEVPGGGENALRRYFTDDPDPGAAEQDFAAEKSALTAEEQPADVDVFLPGWGSWIGPGLKEKKRSVAQLAATLAVAPKLHRVDAGRSRVMIREGARGFAPSFRKHLVKRIPFPYETPEQWEAAVRRPIGREWNTESAHQELCRPRITTRMGAIIEPISKSHVLASKGRKQRDILRQHGALKAQEATQAAREKEGDL